MSDKITEAFAAADAAELKRLGCRGRAEALVQEAGAFRKQAEAKEAEADRFSADERRHAEAYEAALAHLVELGIDRESAAKMVEMRVKLLAPRIDVDLSHAEKPAAPKKKTRAAAAAKPVPAGSDKSDATRTEPAGTDPDGAAVDAAPDGPAEETNPAKPSVEGVPTGESKLILPALNS